MVQTVDTAVLQALERIAAAQLVMAAVIFVIGVIAIGAAVVGLLELRSARRLSRVLTDALLELRPRVAPLLDRVKSLADDAAGMTDDVRRRVDDILHTVEDLNRAVQRGSEATEQRVRRFNAVLDIVQTETEDLLLDAAAAAHGVHETARVLREPSGRGRPAGRPRGRPAPGDDAAQDQYESDEEALP
ncbi:MAG: hypothetical protein WEF86_13370 [Gemmatimonadota bacterium]